MQVIVEKQNSSLYVLEKSTNMVLCQLPNVLVRNDLPAVLKALSILLKGMSVELKKSKYKNGAIKKD